jgi:putative membrane protein
MEQEKHPGRELDDETELSSQRTALSLVRTTLSADRTEMSILRTSLSLIGFGYTIHKGFEELAKSTGMTRVFNQPARNFGFALVILGVGLLVAGIVNNYFLMRGLRQRQQALYDQGLLRTSPVYRASPNLVVSVLLLLTGLLVLLGMLWRAGPFR